MACLWAVKTMGHRIHEDPGPCLTLLSCYKQNRIVLSICIDNIHHHRQCALSSIFLTLFRVMDDSLGGWEKTHKALTVEFKTFVSFPPHGIKMKQSKVFFLWASSVNYKKRNLIKIHTPLILYPISDKVLCLQPLFLCFSELKLKWRILSGETDPATWDLSLEKVGFTRCSTSNPFSNFLSCT